MILSYQTTSKLAGADAESVKVPISQTVVSKPDPVSCKSTKGLTITSTVSIEKQSKGTLKSVTVTK